MQNINKFFRYFILGGIFLIPFVPLVIFNTTFFPFITGKNFAFRIIVELIFSAWAILALLDEKYRPKKSWISIGLFSFIVVMGVADLFGENPFKSFWSNYERMEGYITLLHLFAFFIVTTTVLNTEKLWERFFQTSIGVSVIMCFYGLMQLAGKIVINQGGVRLDATLGNASYLAVYLLIHIFLTAFLFVRSRGFFKWIYGAIILFQMYILYFTETRGSILGLIGGALLATLLVAFFEKPACHACADIAGRENKKLRKISIGILVGIIAVIALFFAFKNTPIVQKSGTLNRLASISLSDKTTVSRFMVWNMAFQGFKERPILGWGQEGFNFVFNKFYDPQMYSQEQWFDRTHDVFLDWLIAGGILGLLTYLSLFASVLYYLWRRENNKLSILERSIITGLLAGYFIHNIFVFDNLMSYILFFMVIGFIHFSNAEPITFARISDRKFDQNKVINFSVPIVIIIFGCVLHFANIKPIFANMTLIKAMSAEGQDPAKSLDLFKQALAYNSFGISEIREQLPNAVFSAVQNTNLSNELKYSYVEFAKNEMIKQADWLSTDARYAYFAGSFFNRVNQPDLAEKYLKKAVEMSPKKQTMKFELATFYLSQKQYDKALELLKAAYDLAPEYDEAIKLYSFGLIYAGKESESDQLLISKFGSTILPDSRYVTVYGGVQKFDKAAEILKVLIQKDPSDIQSRLSLVAAYVQLGKKSEAISEVKKIIEINPELKIQGENYINQIRSSK